MSLYRDRVRAANLAAQHPSVQAKVKEILKQLEMIHDELYWALEPNEPHPLDWTSTMIERAHALVDLSHEYRQALAANPAPKISEENIDEDLPNPR